MIFLNMLELKNDHGIPNSSIEFWTQKWSLSQGKVVYILDTKSSKLVTAAYVSLDKLPSCPLSLIWRTGLDD